MSVLEPMCGYGEGKKILEKYLKKTFEYEGFDSSDTLINTVRADFPDINITKIDVTRYKPAKKYDLIILLGGLHHVPTCAKDVVKNLSEGLKEKGYFISLEATQNNFILKNIRKIIYRTNPVFESDTERAFDLPELNNIFLSGGFKIIEQIYPGLLSYVLYYNPEAFPALNMGNEQMVRFIFNIDKCFFKNLPGKIFSFATLTLLQKRG